MSARKGPPLAGARILVACPVLDLPELNTWLADGRCSGRISFARSATSWSR